MMLEDILKEIAESSPNKLTRNIARQSLKKEDTAIARFSNIAVTGLYVACSNAPEIAQNLLHAFINQLAAPSDRADLENEKANAMFVLSWLAGDFRDFKKEAKWAHKGFELSYEGLADPDFCVAYVEDIGYTERTIQYSLGESQKERAAILAGEIFRYLAYWKLARFHSESIPSNFTSQVEARVKAYISSLQTVLASVG